MAGEGLGRLAFVEAIADGLVGERRCFELEGGVEKAQVDPAACAEEDRAGDVVARHGEGAFALASSGQGGGGDEWGGDPGSGVVGERRGVPWVGEGEFDGEVLEGAPCVVCAAPGEEGVVHGDVAGGCLQV